VSDKPSQPLTSDDHSTSVPVEPDTAADADVAQSDAATEQDLRTLLEMSRALARSGDPKIVGDLVAAHIARATGVDACVVGTWDRATGRLITAGSHPAGRPGKEDGRLVAAYPTIVRVLGERIRGFVDADDHAADPRELLHLRAGGHSFSALVPLVARGSAIGLVELLSVRRIVFDERMLDLAQALANEAAIALENARQHDEATHRAFHDPLTRLANRALFRDRLDQALRRATRGLRSVAVLFVDLDDFKAVNESLGHDIGDELLAAVAQRLEGCLRPGDSTARLGGDEFAVLIEGVEDTSGAIPPAERILASFAKPFRVRDTELYVGASIGIAVGAPGARTPEELLRNAELAMGQAKAGGKGRHSMFEAQLRAAAVDRVELATLLRRALDQNELTLHYQPIVDLASGGVLGFEALVRWQQPERGLLMPAEFLDIADETGLIVPLGRWILREACWQARAWQVRFPSDPPLSLTVNLSARQLNHPALVEDVDDALRTSGLDPGSLVLDLAESLLMTDSAATLTTVRRLKALGVRLAVDDFGSGFSSLAHLQGFPIDILKIDRTIVENVGSAGEQGALVRSIIEIGQDMRLVMIAEGVERADQAAALIDLHCDMAQGYFVNRPAPVAVLDGYLERIVGLG
jgi:diguanylate cyclase (GGDEF)-like protein